MAESSYPFDSQTSTESQWSAYFRNVLDTGVLTGIAPYGDSSGMFVKIPAGQAVVRGFFYINDGLLTLTLTIPQATTSTRIDAVVLRLDPGANTVTAQVRQGTPGAGAPPALTQTDQGIYEMLVGTVMVAPNATTIAANDVTDRRTLSSLPWGRWTTANRPTNTTVGKAGWNDTLKRGEVWDGSNWQPFGTPSTTDAGALTSGTLPNGRLGYGVVAAAQNDRTVDAPIVDAGTISGNWDNVLQPGVYSTFAGYTNTNAPANAYMYGTLMVIGSGPSYRSRTQMYFPDNNIGGGFYIRTTWNGSFSGGWKRIPTIDSVQDAIGAGGSSNSNTGGVGQADLSSSVNVTSSTTTNKTNGFLLLLKTGRSYTLGFNLKANSNISGGTTVLAIPQGARPANPWDFLGRNNSDQVIHMALDTDGYIRVRAGSVGANSELYGTVTYVV